jgi:hypothetical protein
MNSDTISFLTSASLADPISALYPHVERGSAESTAITINGQARFGLRP